MTAPITSTRARLDADPTNLPHSAVSVATGVIGLLGFLAALLSMMASDFPMAARPFICLGACAVPMILWELLVRKVYRNPSTGLDLSYRRPFAVNFRDTVVKLIGLWSTWAIIFLGYWIVRGFEDSKYEFPLLAVLLAAPGLFVLSIPYVMLVDRHMREPRDGLWHMGKWVTGNWRVVDREKLADHARSWFIKSFFLVFMLSIVPRAAISITNTPADALFHDAKSFIIWLINTVFFIDICFGTIGYILTFRVLDSHIRSANPHVWAWIAALSCYPPFALMTTSGPLNYRTHTQEWLVWLQGYDVALVAWGLILLALTVLYTWATVIFGIRFSNLTHRGILTNGPYRLFKHPAYLSKNLFWWFAFMPFLSTGGAEEAVRNCVLLLSINIIYFIRAKTEEKHLMADAEYRLYSDWIAKNGVIPVVLRRFGLRRPGIDVGAAG